MTIDYRSGPGSAIEPYQRREAHAQQEALKRLQENKEMTTAFTIDLDSNSLSFGTVANGQLTNIKGEIKIASELGARPFGGKIEGDFVGDIKAANAIPVTIPHKNENPMGFNIMVVGAGGTGGYLVRDLARFIYALREKGDARQFSLSLIDGDEVEAKNVLRQNFISRDIGKKKSDILAKRYAGTFGIEIQSVSEMADSNLLSLLHKNQDVRGQMIQNIVVGCVDNHNARRAMKQYSDNKRNVYWIDSGNETKSGQAVIGYGRFRNGGGYGSRRAYNTPQRNTVFSLPNVVDLYPEIGDESQDVVEETKVSCAEASIVDTQNIFVNMTAAGHVLSYIRQVVMGEPITINAIEFNIKGVTNVKHITEVYLKENYDRLSGNNSTSPAF
jgi:PRTRC genetic system ThiF family protein